LIAFKDLSFIDDQIPAAKKTKGSKNKGVKPTLFTVLISSLG
jgi:hypothetical protein